MKKGTCMNSKGGNMLSTRRWVVLGIALAFLAGSVVCVQAESAEQTGKQVEKEAEDAGKQASKSGEEAGQEAGEAMRETGKEVGEGFKKAGKEIGGFFKGLTKGKEDKEE